MIMTRGYGKYNQAISRGFGGVLTFIYKSFKDRLVLIAGRSMLIEAPKIKLLSKRNKHE